MPLRHALEVRHDSFRSPEFIDLARRYGVAVVYAESDEYPAIADGTADFVYARLQRCREGEANGYPAEELDLWADRARAWRAGTIPAGLPALCDAPAGTPRDVFVFFIAGDKVRAPAAATALIERL